MGAALGCLELALHCYACSDEEGGLQTEDEEDDDLDDQGELVRCRCCSPHCAIYPPASCTVCPGGVKHARGKHLMAACASCRAAPQKPSAHPAHTLQADLIGTAKETHKDLHKRDELHRQWAEQQDAKELQQVLRGLKHGFRRRGRGGFMEEEVRPGGLGWDAGTGALGAGERCTLQDCPPS